MSGIAILLLGLSTVGGMTSASSPTPFDAPAVLPVAGIPSARISSGTFGDRFGARPAQIGLVQFQLAGEPVMPRNLPGADAGGTMPRDHVILPPAWAGTPLSFQIHAEACYFAAYGDAVESMAVARKINAEAVALEIQNSIDAVDAYFKRRELNSAYRDYYINPETVERRHQDRLKRNVDERYQSLLKGDVTKTMNWLLQELAGPVIACQVSPGARALADVQLDPKLTPNDLKLIRLTDGGGKLVFAANDGQVLMPSWPLALQAAEFEPLRRQYEQARDTAVDDAKTDGAIGFETANALRESVIALMVALEAAYPPETRAEFSKFDLYYTSKRYLQALWGGVHRATTTKDPSALSGGLRFEGDSLVSLLQHMCGSGLAFAPPEPGGEGVYKKLFHGMRNLYVNFGSERP